MNDLTTSSTPDQPVQVPEPGPCPRSLTPFEPGPNSPSPHPAHKSATRTKRLSTPHVREHRAALRHRGVKRLETRLDAPTADLLKRLAGYENQTLAKYLAEVLRRHANRKRMRNPTT